MQVYIHEKYTNDAMVMYIYIKYAVYLLDVRFHIHIFISVFIVFID